MASQPNDDLFAGTTMTFGEHLEELRVALFRSLFGLMIGVVIGFFLAETVVKFIQTPLQKALREHKVERAMGELGEKYNFGEGTQADEKKKAIQETLIRENLLPDKVFIEAQEVERLTKLLHQADDAASINEEELKGLKDPGLPDTDEQTFLLMRVWRTINVDPTALNPQEAFLIWFKAAIITGLVITGPWIFYQLWLFVAAGLYPHEKGYVYIFLPFSLALFVIGVSFAFFFVFDVVLSFLFSFNTILGLNTDVRMSEWLGFVLFLPLGFGVSFQLPLVMLFLQRIGLFTVQSYLSSWRIAVVVICVISMILTPADVMSMAMMAVPLTLLYFLGVGLCHWWPGVRRNPFGEAEDI